MIIVIYARTTAVRSYGCEYQQKNRTDTFKNIVCVVFHFVIFFFRFLRILDASVIKKRGKDKHCSKHGKPGVNSNSSSSEDSINLIDENNLYQEEGNAQKNRKGV